MSALTPDMHCATVLDIDADELAATGVSGVLLDLDNTLLARGASELAPETAAWIRGLREHGLEIAIISNTNNERTVRIAGGLGVALVRNAFKPLRHGYVRACAALGIACRDAVMIGDQSYTDVLGAHRVGMSAILVDPLCDVDPIHTRALRVVDRIAARRATRPGLSFRA